MSAATGRTALLELRDVVREYPVKTLTFRRSTERIHAVSGVSFQVEPGETYGLVGESGCGKSTTARLAVGMEKPTTGAVIFDGGDLASARGGERRRQRRELQMVFQDPYSSLDPKMNVADLIAEPLVVQRIGRRKQRHTQVERLLGEVGLPAVAARRYPHELSGGQRQRVAIARALALRPRLIVADEPVSALDVSVRAQILNLMADLQEEHGLSYLMVAHDLAIVRHVSHRVGVMYLGKLVETGSTDDVIARPAHPYTAKLLSAVPEADPHRERAKERQRGVDETPSAIRPPSGCRFRTRCPLAQEICAEIEPAMQRFGDGQQAACHFPLRPALPETSAEIAPRMGEV